MLPQEIIRRKRDGHALDPIEIATLVRGIVEGGFSEGQIAAFAMAVFFRGMAPGECAALTRAMADSGRRLDWADLDLPSPVLDKHSTGGVGDKVSLILAPLVAACGGFVPMVAGRGLGHTGGTVDKLESIPGYRTEPPAALFRQAVAAAGCAIVGQSADLAPADRRLYAVRDVTATVESIPLITASILAKKLAAGVGRLVMDVKVGSGAFLTEAERGLDLARSLVSTATATGLPTAALLTDMDQVLGRSAGNALELQEAIAYLTGGARDPRLEIVVESLGAEMLRLGGLAADGDAARRRLRTALTSGAAAERFQRMVAALGGPADLVQAPARHLPPAPVVRPAPPARPGVIAAIDVRQVGLAVVGLGGGRRHVADRIDHRVGLTAVLGLGEATGPDRPLALVHAPDAESAEAAARTVAAAFTIADEAIEPPPAIVGRVEAPAARPGQPSGMAMP